MTRPSNFAMLLDSSSDEESAEQEEEVSVKQPVARISPTYKPGDFVCISSEEDVFTYRVIRVGDHQFEGQLRIARIGANFRDKNVSFWTAAESLVKVESSDPRLADLGAKKGKKANAKDLEQGACEVEETLFLAAIEAAAEAGEGKDAVALAKVAPTAVRPR